LEGFLSKKKSLFAIFLTFSLDMLSMTIIFPILAPLILSPTQSIFRSNVSDSFKMILLGVFLASFPMAQFISSPILGDLADRKGRRTALLVTVFLSTLANILSAWSIQTVHLSVLFIARFIAGLAAGNTTICLASLADLSPSEEKKRLYFSYGSIVAGSLFVLGPFLGGKLSDNTLNPFFNPAFPFWIAAVFALINLCILFFVFKETLLVKLEGGHLDALKAFHNIGSVLTTPAVKNLYIVYFLALFAWNIVFQFLPALMVIEFDSTNSTIGDVSAIMGLVWIFGTVCVTSLLRVVGKIKPILLATVILFAVFSLLIAFPRDLTLFIYAVGLVVFFGGGMWPLFTLLFSSVADSSLQGRVMGFSQAVQSFSMVLAPLIGGFLIQIHSTIPFLISTVSAVVAIILLARMKLEKV
jgi:DHA1 family tetracycline resistance protein-like MFS transporter